MAEYLGETGRNIYMRELEHLKHLEARNKDKSVLWLHSVHHHQGRAEVPYSLRVTGSFKDCINREGMRGSESHIIMDQSV